MSQSTERKNCQACSKPVSFADELDLGHGTVVHLKCFKCAKCNIQLSPSDKYQLHEHSFYCKEHKQGGMAKQFQERAKRSLKSAMKGAPKLFATPAKQKPPKEVGAPTTLPLDSPYSDRHDNSSQAQQEQVSDLNQEGEDFVTVIDDAEETVALSRSLQLQTTATSSPASPTGVTMMVNSMDFQTPPIRRSSTVASTPSMSHAASPSLQPYEDMAAIIPTITSTVDVNTDEMSTPGKDVEAVAQFEPEKNFPKPSAITDSPSQSREEKDVTSHVSSSDPTVESEIQHVPSTTDEEMVVVDSETPKSLQSEKSSPIHHEEEGAFSPGPSEARTTSIEEDEHEEDFGESMILESHSVAMLQEDSDGEVKERQVDPDEVEFDDDDDEDQSPEKPPKPSDPLKILTTAVAKELEILPQSAQRSGDEEDDQEEVEQPWVYPPAFSGVSPMQISVVDPDHLWMFIESPLMERMAHSKVGGARRAKFIPSDALKPVQAVPIYSRYRNPYLHMYLVRCETVHDYTSSIRPRLKAFKEDVEHREDSEWLLVLVESSSESKKVAEKMKQDFSKERVVTVSVSDDQRWLGKEVQATKLRPAGDGQWGDLAQRVGTSIVRAYVHRRPLYKKGIDDEVEREMDWNYFNLFTKAESLAFASLQVDRFEEALEIYTDLNIRFKRAMEQRDPLMEKIVKCGMTDESGSSVKRLPCWKLLFPAVSAGSTEQDAIRAQIHRTFPARIFDVERLPFRDLIGTSTVSGIQLQMYLMSRIVLCLLALGRAREAIETSRQFLFALRANLRAAYPKDLTCVDAWMVAASLEVVAAGHACASVFAREVDPSDRVGMCLAQAILLERSRSAMEDISARECPLPSKVESAMEKDGPGGRKFIPELAVNSHSYLIKDTNLPVGLARAFYSSPDSFRTMYGRLLEASAAHFVAAGRFRFAASLTHRRAILLNGSGSLKRQEDAQLLFEDAGRWWGGSHRTVVFGQGTADVGTTLHDNWPSLRAETCLYVVGSIDKVAKVAREVRPDFRRYNLATRIFTEATAREYSLIPVHLSISFAAGGKEAIKFTEDERWHGEMIVQWTALPELLTKKGLFTWKDISKAVIRFQSSSSMEAKDSVFIDVEASVEEASSNSDGGIDLKKTFKAVSRQVCEQLGAYSPTEAFIYIRGIRLKALIHSLSVSSPVFVVERPFPYVAEIVCPKVVASGTSFVKQIVESDVVSTRQEFVLRIKRREDCKPTLEFGECEAVVSLSEGMEIAEAKDGKASVTSLVIRFEGSSTMTLMEKRFTVVVAAKNKQQGTGTGSVFVDFKCLKDSRSAPRQRTDFLFHPPIQVIHDIRFAGEDVAAISLIVENNLKQYGDLELEVLGCSLVNLSTEETMMRSSPVSPFPFKLKASLTSLTQSFLLYGLRTIVPERIGSKSVIILQATVNLRFVEDATECTLSWYAPLLIRRADVMRQRWKEGESFSFLPPPIEDASFGMDWKEVMQDEEEDSIPIIIDESLEVENNGEPAS